MEKRLLVVAISGLVGMVYCPPAKADLLSVTPTTQSAGIGSSVGVEVTISGLGASSAPSLGAYDVNILFNPGILQFLDAVIGDPVLGDQLDLSGFGSISSVTPGAGTVELFELSLDSIDDLNNLQAPAFVLATLDFKAIGVGTSPVSISINALADAYGDALTAGIQNGTVVVSSVAAVPEPTSLLLLTTVLAWVVSRRRFRHS